MTETMRLVFTSNVTTDRVRADLTMDGADTTKWLTHDEALDLTATLKDLGCEVYWNAP